MHHFVSRMMRKLLPEIISPTSTDLPADHRALESDLFEVAHRLIDEQLDAADVSLSLFGQRLRHHMAIEQAELASRLDPLSNARLERDHATLSALFDATAVALRARDRGRAMRTLARLASCLGDHSDREHARLGAAPARARAGSER